MKTLQDLSPREAARLSDAAEAAAYADLFDAAPAQLRAATGLEVRRIEGATLLLAPRLPTTMFNRAIGLGMGEEAAEATLADVDAIAREYAGAGVRDWWLHVNPHARPASLADDLQARGWTTPARHHWAKLLRAATPATPVETSLRIAPSTDADVQAATSAIARAFEMPPPMAGWLSALHGRPTWRVYTAHDGDAVVGGACLFVDGPLAWLGMGAVLPSHRRRGGQGALLARRIDDARALGVQWIATETGEPITDEHNPSLANMKRSGLVTVASRINLRAP